ncbi:hypothetical protein [Streptomyces sp. enrichment culture]|uniref:hypothetical protein n=1 Tax=Streptomyces sp. enrichment culture TaxID=1795815 RepID=UPI003F546F0D
MGARWFCAKDVTPADRIEFTDTETDIYGLPAMRIHHRSTDRGLATIEEAKKAVAEAGAGSGTPAGRGSPATTSSSPPPPATRR